MAALVESVGGTTRIILARNNTIGGHAYAEVYLGKINYTNNQVEAIINWLKNTFVTDKIYTHIDTDTRDVWLNLDWGRDELGNSHPGGPIFQGDKHMVLCIRDDYGKTPLKISNSNNYEEMKPFESSKLNSDSSSSNEKDTSNSEIEDPNDPAIAFCIKRGNIYKDGVCTFPGGSSCDVWDFYRGDCILTGRRR